jgi:acyl-CoA synthetase (AMP-forming)/AMP-acid ligase II
MILEDYLEQNARLYPDKTAVVCGAETCSYLQLYKRSLARAAEYSHQRRRLVLFRASQSIDFLVTYFAIHLADAVAAPLEKDMPQDMFDDMVRNVSSNVLPDGIADVLFTTGTTGLSKGVMISHRAIIANAENLIAGQGFTHELVFIINGPLNHIGSLSKIFPVIVQGATLLIIDGMRDFEKFFDALDYPTQKMATFFVPANVRMLTQFCSNRLALYAKKLDFIECGGAPLPHSDMVELCRLLPHTRLYNTYASTETGIVSTYNYNDGRCIARCLGKPMPHSRIIITPEGHISCQGDTLMSGYFDDPELTATVLHGETVCMSDIGSIDNEGMLHINGRQDDVINVGGYKVAPTEVEEAALQLPVVNDCICISVPHPITGNALKLLVVLSKGEKLNKRKLALHLRQRLEIYKVPMIYEQVETIERTYNGKINRKFYRKL